VSGIESPPEPSNVRKISQLFIHDEPTIVHRTQFKSRPSLIEPSTSPSTSNGKSSDPRPAQSTGKTSLDSKFSSKSIGIAQRSSENKKVMAKQLIPGDFGSSTELSLAPIAEVEMADPEPVPSKSI
jgi:hypothetical protein